MAVVAMVASLIIIELIIVAIAIGGARDHDLTIRRINTLQAFYASEAGMAMAIRELMEEADEDGDGTIGTISDDSNDANDPAIGNGRLVVTATADTPAVGQTTLTSEGRAGVARRNQSTVIE